MLFAKTKNKTLAGKVSIKSPSDFKRSIRRLQVGGLTKDEKKALVLARTRAKLQLLRKGLSKKERREFKAIARTKLPKITKK